MKKYNIVFIAKAFFDNVEANTEQEALDKCVNGEATSSYIKPTYLFAEPEVTESVLNVFTKDR